ncbi:MAG: GNAT family N-acetyltransferase [Candidatus Zixiibacteriota bacterium]|nr:MAG: GNAT family N-acetyltransferase [candidate division Zixibacteria bacterium]
MSDSVDAKADIVPYTSEYSVTVRSWIDSPETLQSLCRSDEFPPAQDIVDSWQLPTVSAYILFAERKPVAYGEILHRKLERAFEIAHLIVDPSLRSRGYGIKMLKLLYDRAAVKPGITKVLINIHTPNEEALGCYLKAGFELVGTSTYGEGLQMIRTVFRRN